MAPKRLDPKTYIELSVSVRRPKAKAKTEATDFFLHHGFQLRDITYFEHKDRLRVAVYSRIHKQIEKIKKDLPRYRKTGWQFKERILEREDWLDKWQLSYQITPVGSGFMIVPAWKAREFEGKRIPIYLDPQGAFGSGTHETTKLVIRLMEKCAARCKKVFDVGVGTGVLMIAAAKLGAEKVSGIDHDRDSIRTAIDNFNRNRIMNAFVFYADITDLKLRREQYDLVTANLLSETLERAARPINLLLKKGGYLIVSGISRRNLRDFLRRFKIPKLRCVKVLNGKTWAACLYRKYR